MNIGQIVVVDDRPSKRDSTVLEAMKRIEHGKHMTDDEKKRRILQDLAHAGLAQTAAIKVCHSSAQAVL